jgi:hypothetical protein
MEMKRIKFKHWKEDRVLIEVGRIIHDKPESYRIVLQTPRGDYIDIIRDTIVEIEDV